MTIVRGVLAALVSLFLVVPTICRSQDHQSATSGSSELVSIIALSDSGDVMVEAVLFYGEDWVLIDVGDPLTLDYGMPLSLAWKRQTDETECPIGAMNENIVTHQVLLKPPSTTTRCPYPMHPSGLFYSAELEDGGRVVVRLREEDVPHSVMARIGNKEFELVEFSVEDLVELQLSGTGLEQTNLENVIVEYRIADLDTLSWQAYQTSSNQAELLDRAAEILAELLGIYHERSGNYPGTMCQLYAGSDAIVSAIPRNPFAWNRNLCDTEHSLPCPKGVLRYFPQRVGGESGATGYWLAITGTGTEVHPEVPLSAEFAAPFRVIRWVEQHPGELAEETD